MRSMKNSDAPRYGMIQLSPDELIEQQMAIRESAIEKLVLLGLTREEVMSLISIDISQGG